jgi:hypothetical protein
MRIPDSYLDQGNPWTEDFEYCNVCGERSYNYDWIDNEPTCHDCQCEAI